MSYRCDFCDSSAVAEILFSDRVAAGRRRVALSGLRKMVCHDCGEEYMTEAQVEHNHALFDAAVAVTPEAVYAGLMRSLRERWQLTQKAASALFGAGESAFAKWESGQPPSGPAALLIQCAVYVPGVMEYLARVQSASLPGCPELSDWSADGANVTGTLAVHKSVRRLARVHHVPAPVVAPARMNYSPNVVELYGEAA